MLWALFTKGGRGSRAEAMVRTHSRFLSAAAGAEHHYPRIPVRRVDQGGFGVLMSRTRGRLAAEAWWARAFGQVPDFRDE